MMAAELVHAIERLHEGELAGVGVGGDGVDLDAR